jgi:hypothetical protein
VPRITRRKHWQKVGVFSRVWFVLINYMQRCCCGILTGSRVGGTCGGYERVLSMHSCLCIVNARDCPKALD